MSVPYEPPRRVVLGADAWQLLVGELGGVVLPAPLRAEDGPELDGGQRAAARAALRDSGVLLGERPLADLHPSVRASLTVHLHPDAVVDTVVQRGPERTTVRHAAAGVLASGLSRTTVEVTGGRQTGPVELSTLLVDDLAAEVVASLGVASPVGERVALRLDAAASLAVVRALRDGRDQVAASLAGGSVPAALEAVAGGVEAVARIELSGPDRRHVLVVLGTTQGWWSVHTTGEDVVLRPVDADVLVTQVATALTGSLVGGAA